MQKQIESLIEQYSSSIIVIFNILAIGSSSKIAPSNSYPLEYNFQIKSGNVKYNLQHNISYLVKYFSTATCHGNTVISPIFFARGS